MAVDGWGEISAEHLCGLKKCSVLADSVDAEVMCSGKWNVMIQSGSGDLRDTAVEGVIRNCFMN